MTSDSDGLSIRALALFERSLDQPSDGRTQWICDQAAGDEALQAKALSYLSRDISANGAFSTGGAFHETLDDTAIPDHIGAYRITGLIGRGGMGAVYRGERASGDFDHDVAIKLVRPGALSETSVTRFQNERQTLAKLSHPNIARLYDGGTGENGAPYIVMEFIDGLPITVWCDKNKLSLKDRLALFQVVCEAVSYAHQNLIIHRDITPSNVLVDISGQVKLIDFGIAKPFGADVVDADMTASVESMSFTAGFAAPERAHIAGANTLSDVYSLGKLLNALVTPGSVDLELKAIIDKATASNPEDRYDMVNILNDDIDHYRKGFPVEAIVPSPGYSFQKFIFRHKTSSFLTLLVVIGLFAAFGSTFMQYKRAEAARQEADARFGETRALTSFLLNDLGTGLNKLSGTLPLQRKVNETSVRYLNILAEAVKTNESLKLEYALARAQLGSILTDEGGRNLYDPAEGLKQYEISLEILTQLAASPKASDETRKMLANMHMKYTYLYRFYYNDLSKFPTAAAIAEPIYTDLLKSDPGNVEIITALLHLRFERWTMNIKRDTEGRLDDELVDMRRVFEDVLTDDFSNFNYVINYSGILSLFIDYAVKKWNAPYGKVPSSDREEYIFLLDWIEKCFEISKARMEENPTSSEDIYNYFWGLEVLVDYAAQGVEWRPSLPDLQTYLQSYSGGDGRKAIRQAQQDDTGFASNLIQAERLKKYLRISDELLEQLKPLDQGTYSYQEVVEQNMISRAYIATNLSFDLDVAEEQIISATQHVDDYLLAAPDEEFIRFASAELRLQRVLLLIQRDKLYNEDSSKKICKTVKEVESIASSHTMAMMDAQWIGKGHALLASLEKQYSCGLNRTYSIE